MKTRRTQTRRPPGHGRGWQNGLASRRRRALHRVAVSLRETNQDEWDFIFISHVLVPQRALTLFNPEISIRLKAISMNIWHSPGLICAIRRLRFLSAGLAVVLVASCGGGTDDDATRYQSVAMAGELIDYTVDTTNLTYKYTITESQFGLAGRTGDGTLTSNADGSYTPSGAPDARVIVLPNGLLFGAVRERFGESVVTTPIIGVKDPVTTMAALAADYNYVQRSCASAACSVSHGTFRILADGTWTSCRNGNVAVGPCTGTANNGTLESRDGGLFRMKTADGTDIGTAIGVQSGGQNVLIVDLKDQRAGGSGVGLIVGGQQETMSPTVTDGTWVAATGSGDWLLFTAKGSDINITQIDWLPVNLSVTFATNQPWPGMATTAWGDIGFIVGSGVYMLETPAGDVELGVRLH